MTAPLKIGKIKTEKTDEQENSAWAEVMSHKNKLLLNSDWTQLPDSGLTDECIDQWKGWRQQLKNINRSNFADKGLAEQHIAKLSRRTPFNSYRLVEGDEPTVGRYTSTEEYRGRVVRYLDEAFNSRLNGSFLDNPALVEEQFKEAIDHLSGKADSMYPLLDVTAELYGMNRNAVAEEFVMRKVESIKRMANLRQKYHYFQMLVRDAVNDVQLADIQAEIKLWISTST